MTSFLLALYRALTRPDGAVGDLLSTRRKSHLLQAEWYAHLAQQGEAEREQATASPSPEARPAPACQTARHRLATTPAAVRK